MIFFLSNVLIWEGEQKGEDTEDEGEEKTEWGGVEEEKKRAKEEKTEKQEKERYFICWFAP